MFAILDALTCVADLPLRGAGGEPVDFARTIVEHGVAELPPNRVDLEARTFETTLGRIHAMRPPSTSTLTPSSSADDRPSVSAASR